MRITIMGLNYAPEPTGIAPYTTRLAEGLIAAGHDVHVLTGYPHYPHWKLQPGYSGWQSKEILNGVSVHRLRQAIPRRVTNFQRVHMELSFGLRLLFARWNKPDVVLIVTPALLSSAPVLLRKHLGRRKPAVGIWVQDIYSRGLAETATGGSQSVSSMKRLEGRIFRAADQISVIHDRFKEYLVKALDVPAEKVVVIRNWTHTTGPRPSCEREAVRLRYGWTPDDIIVVHAGNMGVKQGLENVVNAARIAETSRSRVKFVLLGDGNQRAKIEESARGLCCLELLPPVPGGEFEEILGAADLLLVNELPGLREMAVPSKLTSYFGAGVPVVAATDSISTTASEIRRSRAGIVVEPGNPRALLESVENLYANKTYAHQLGEAGRLYATNSLSEDAAIVLYTEWLQDLSTV